MSMLRQMCVCEGVRVLWALRTVAAREVTTHWLPEIEPEVRAELGAQQRFDAGVALLLCATSERVIRTKLQTHTHTYTQRDVAMTRNK